MISPVIQLTSSNEDHLAKARMTLSPKTLTEQQMRHALQLLAEKRRESRTLRRYGMDSSPAHQLAEQAIEAAQARCNELADHPDLPFYMLKEQLLQGHGWLNPSLPLHLVLDPLLSAAGTPCQVLAGLLMHFRLNLPIETELLHWEVLCDVSADGAIFARTKHVGPTDEQFAALAPWSDLARALYQAWLVEPIAL